jgi:hypothetical protein
VSGRTRAERALRHDQLGGDARESVEPLVAVAFRLRGHADDAEHADAVRAVEHRDPQLVAVADLLPQAERTASERPVDVQLRRVVLRELGVELAQDALRQLGDEDLRRVGAEGACGLVDRAGDVVRQHRVRRVEELPERVVGVDHRGIFAFRTARPVLSAAAHKVDSGPFVIPHATCASVIHVR